MCVCVCVCVCACVRVCVHMLNGMYMCMHVCMDCMHVNVCVCVNFENYIRHNLTALIEYRIYLVKRDGYWLLLAMF